MIFASHSQTKVPGDTNLMIFEILIYVLNCRRNTLILWLKVFQNSCASKQESLNVILQKPYSRFGQFLFNGMQGAFDGRGAVIYSVVRISRIMTK